MYPAMHKTISKIISKLSLDSVLNNRRLVIFTLCLVTATILWFLNALSKNYTTNLNYPVKYINLPRNKFIINDPPKNLNLKVYGHGFTLLRYKMRFAVTPFALNISEIFEENKPPGSGSISIVTGNIIDNVSGQISSDIQIMDIKPAAISLVFDSLESRLIPIKPLVDISFRSRFGLAGNMVTIPAIVLATGPRALIESIDTIYTRHKIIKNVDEDLTTEIALEIPKKISVDYQKAVVKIPVDEFTEKSFSVPITMRSIPGDMRIRLFPREVKVSFNIGLRQFSLVTPDSVTLYVNGEEIEAGAPTLQVHTDYYPPGIKSLKISPPHVEYLIEKN
jgi:hypothetical protein